jgi:hypothetical protein
MDKFGEHIEFHEYQFKKRMSSLRSKINNEWESFTDIEQYSWRVFFANIAHILSIDKIIPKYWELIAGTLINKDYIFLNDYYKLLRLFVTLNKHEFSAKSKIISAWLKAVMNAHNNTKNDIENAQKSIKTLMLLAIDFKMGDITEDELLQAINAYNDDALKIVLSPSKVIETSKPEVSSTNVGDSDLLVYSIWRHKKRARLYSDLTDVTGTTVETDINAVKVLRKDRAYSNISELSAPDYAQLTPS